MGAHLIDGKFVSDKFPGTPPGHIVLNTASTRCQDLLWELADRYDGDDKEFADDLRLALQVAGFKPGETSVGDVTVGEIGSAIADAGTNAWKHAMRIGGNWVGRGGRTR